MPNTIIDKYPIGSNRAPMDVMNNALPNASSMPKALRETKNNQLFEKYMNRHSNQYPKNRLDIPPNQPLPSSGPGSAMNMLDQGGSISGNSNFELPALTSPMLT